MTANRRQPIPIDIFHRIISLIPTSQAKTLATCLLLSKEYCHIAARKLYRNVHIRADTDLLVDTGLPAALLAPGGAHETDNQDASCTEDEDAAERKEEGSENKEGSVPRTLKGRFLSMMRTLDIRPRSRSRIKVRVLVYADGGESEEDEPAEPAVKRLPSPLTGLKLQLEQVRFRLDTSHHSRPSPFDTPLTEPDLESFQEHLLGMIRTRRLVFHGASFSMSSSFLRQIAPSFLEQLQEVAVVICPGGPLVADGKLGVEHGLSHIYQHLIKGHVANSGIPRAADITFVVQTPTSFSTVVPPSGDISTYPFSNPRRESIFIHGMLEELAGSIVNDWVRLPKESCRKIALVGFNSMNGAKEDMPRYSRIEKRDRYRTLLNDSIRRLFEGDYHLQGSSFNIGSADWEESIDVIGMEDWLAVGRSRDQVLDEGIVAD